MMAAYEKLAAGLSPTRLAASCSLDQRRVQQSPLLVCTHKLFRRAKENGSQSPQYPHMRRLGPTDCPDFVGRLEC